MKNYLFPIIALAVCGCSSVKDDSYEAETKARYKEQRIEIVAQSLIKEGKATNMEEAKPLAVKIVEREIADQKDAALDNEHGANFFKEGDKRVE